MYMPLVRNIHVKLKTFSVQARVYESEQFVALAIYFGRHNMSMLWEEIGRAHV